MGLRNILLRQDGRLWTKEHVLETKPAEDIQRIQR